MNNLTEQSKHTSDIAHGTMTIVPVDVLIKGRVAGPIDQASSSTSFELEMSDQEYGKFHSQREVQRSPLV